jgi:predicted enzyme related to lactoylglutathione lyase
MKVSKSPITKPQGSGVQSVGGSILHVDDLEKMVSWYGDILDMPTDMNPDVPFHVFDMDNGVNLMLDDHRNMENQTKHPICMLMTMDIEQSYAWMKECGIPIVLEMQKHPTLTYFNFKDSENNIVMIASSTWVNPQPIAPNHADHPIKNHLNCIVIPVKDLKRATEWYANLLGHAIKPERQDGGPIYWFDMDNGTGILLDDNRQHEHFEKYPTFMLKAPNIREAYRYMQSKNTRILVEIEHDHHFFIQDPEGNSVIICM